MTMLKNEEQFRKELENIKEMFDVQEEKREEIINVSRTIVRSSKQAIQALHKDDAQRAQKLIDEAKQAIEQSHALLEQTRYSSVGNYNAGIEEYVEAVSYYSFITTTTLPTIKELGLSFDITPEQYLLGICDLPGELGRKAVTLAIQNNKEEIEKIFDVIEFISENLLSFDFRPLEFRKKVESIKYQLTKVQNILYDMTLKSR